MIKDYNWDVSAWVERNLRFAWRKPAFIAWLVSLLAPIQTLANDLLARSIHYRRIVQYSSQQMAFSAILNDLFDPDDRRIRVETSGDDEIHLYIRKQDESFPPKVYVRLKSESIDQVYIRLADENEGGEFIVYAPTAIQAQEDNLKAWIDFYKLADKHYVIIYE